MVSCKGADVPITSLDCPLRSGYEFVMLYVAIPFFKCLYLVSVIHTLSRAEVVVGVILQGNYLL